VLHKELLGRKQMQDQDHAAVIKLLKIIENNVCFLVFLVKSADLLDRCKKW